MNENNIKEKDTNEKSQNKKRIKNAVVIWFTGLSGSGKSTIAEKVFEYLYKNNIPCEILDGDIMRQSLSKDLGFSKEDRDKNIERAIFVSNLLSKHGIIILATFISPYKTHRLLAKKEIENFVEIFINAPLSVCENRDTKGLYKRALNGEIKNFTGIDDLYEEPEHPNIELRTDLLSIEDCVSLIIDYLKKQKFI